jgi:hypothetical protein
MPARQLEAKAISPESGKGFRGKMIASLRAVVARSLRLPRRRQLLGLASGFAAAWLASGVASYAASPGDDAPAAAPGAPPAPIDLRRYPNLRPFMNRPPLPALVVPLDVVEPRRDVRASEWAAPYCTDWSDGVERCVRSAALRKPICVPAETPESERHPVACDNADQNVLNLVCFRYAVVNPGRLGALFLQVNWDWAARGWRPEYGEHSAMGARNYSVTSYLRRKGVTGPVAEKRTYHCFQTYEKPIDWKKISPGSLPN